MPQLVKQEIANTIPTAFEDSPDYKYEELLTAGKTGTYVCGLIAIKNVKRNTQWGEKDAYRFVFRVGRDPECRCYVTTTVNASCKDNSSMYKLLRNMSGKQIDTLPNSSYADSDKLFDFMLRCVDHWFEVDAIGVQMGDSVMSFVDGEDVKPCKSPPDKVPSEFFVDTIDSTQTGLEKYPDCEQAHNAKEKAELDQELEEDSVPW